MSIDTLKINQQVELVIKGMKDGSFSSRVEEITPEAIHVATPLYKSYLMNFRPGDRLEVNYLNNSAVFSFDTYVLESRLEPIPVLVLAKPDTFRKIQRRHFVRLEARLPLTVARLNYQVEVVVKTGPYQGTFPTQVEEVGEKFLRFYLPLVKERFLPLTTGTEVDLVFTVPGPARYWFTDSIKAIQYSPTPLFAVDRPVFLRSWEEREGLRIPLDFRRLEAQLADVTCSGETVDISGGGLMFQSSFPFAEGDPLDLLLDLPGYGKLRAFGSVIRSIAKDKYKYRTSVKFTHIQEGDRDKIIQFIFRRQIELRRKGLL